MTIDGQLVQAGWLVQSREEINRSAGLGVAVREFPTASGPVDYALFVGGTLCGVEMGLALAGVPHAKGGVEAAMAYLAQPARKAMVA